MVTGLYISCIQRGGVRFQSKNFKCLLYMIYLPKIPHILDLTKYLLAFYSSLLRLSNSDIKLFILSSMHLPSHSLPL